MFYKISSSVGSGKTQAVLEYIRDNLGEGYLYVCPTVALCEEIYRRLLRVLINRPEYVNNGPIRLVAGDNQEGPVFPRAIEACRNYDRQLPPIVIVTTTTYEHLLDQLFDDEKRRFHVFIDEGLPPIKPVQFSPIDLATFLVYFERDGEGFAQPSKGQQEVLEWVAHTPQKLAGRQLQHLNIPQFREIAELVISTNYEVYLVETKRSIEVLGFLSPEPMRSFQSVTLVVAIIERTLLPIVWEQRHDVVLEDFPLRSELYDTHEAKGPSITIWHALHEDDLPSKRNFGRNYETGEPNEKEERQQVVYRAAQQIEAYMQNACEGVYCWAANNSFNNSDGVLTGERMPAASAGLDGYRRYNCVVSLLCINPPPWVRSRILEVLHLEEDKLYELWRFSHTYQAIGRCSLRARDNTGLIEIVVPSSRCAEQLSELFPGSNIAGQITDLPRYSQHQADQAPIQEFGMSYTRADNKAYSVYRKRCGNNGEEPLEKQRWFREVRRPRLLLG